MKQYWLLLSALLMSTQVMAFPHSSPVPGGIVEIPLAAQTDAPPSAYFDGNRVAVVPWEQQWLALVGIPLDTAPGTYQVTTNTGETFDFEVNNKKYRTQHVTIKDKNKVDPDEESSERIVREMAIQKKIKLHFTNQPVDLDFIQPVPGQDSGRFGSRRIFNGQPRSPHSGMDIPAASGTPVKATAKGRVLHVDDFFFSGNVIYVDHGAGVISLYAHLSKVLVQPGEEVQAGNVIGEVGSTGRATGPHLHWSVYLNGAAVDPALFL